jgi:phenylacetate-CoA ligase
VIYEPELETLPRKQLRALQTEHLRALLAYVKERAPLYRERLADVEPGDIASVDDLGDSRSRARTTCGRASAARSR